jgi:hypothetical protein
MSVFLDGIAAQFYRGIGADVQFIGPFSRMNFFIGANNAGKSIVLGLLAEQLNQMKSGRNIKPLYGPDVHTARETGQFMLAVGRRTETVAEAVINQHEGKRFQHEHGGYPTPTFRTEVEKICDHLSVESQIWAILKERQQVQVYPEVVTDSARAWVKEWHAVWSLLTGVRGGGWTHWIPDTINVIGQNVLPSLPNIYLVPAKRILGNRDEAFEDLSGKGLIDLLATLQQPNWDTLGGLGRKSLRHWCSGWGAGLQSPPTLHGSITH